jgi:hypothetical protein
MRRMERSDLDKKAAGVRGSIKYIFILAALASLSLLAACQLPDFGAFLKEPAPKLEAITTNAEEITLEWDAPIATAVSYDVYVRTHAGSVWQVLGSVGAMPQPEYTVLHSALGNGEYDFAIIAVNDEGDRSAYHTSLDSTAQPNTGWYLAWYR